MNSIRRAIATAQVTVQLLSLSMGGVAALSSTVWAMDCLDPSLTRTGLEAGVGTDPFDALMQCASGNVPTIIKILTTDDNPLVRGSAADALGKINADAAVTVPALVNALQTDENASVRWRAISALAQIGAEATTAIPELAKVLRSDQSVDLQKRAAYAIAKISFALQGNMSQLSDSELNQAIATLTQAVEAIAQAQQQHPDDIPPQAINDVQVPLEALINDRQSRLLNKLRERTLGVWLTHMMLWLLLIFAYPKYPPIQAIFFWNPWVRRFLGLGYVGLVLTWVPFLRAKLFSPFQDSLLADADLEHFDPQAYFPDLWVRSNRAAQPQPIQTAIPVVKGQIVLEGESGLGKSMFLRHLARSSRRILVYLPAKRCQQGVLEAIQAKLHGAAKDEDFLRSLIYSGAIDICIDGLNEVSANTRAQITYFAESYSKGNIIMATQPLEWQPPAAAQTYMLQALSREQIETFLISRYSTVLAAIETTGAIATISAGAYESACKTYLNELFQPDQSTEDWNAMRRILSNPMDLTLVAQILATGEQPNLFHLQAQQYHIMAEDYQTRHLRRFPLQAFSEMVYQMRLTDQDVIPTERFFDELLCMERYKMVICRQSVNSTDEPRKDWFFRHDKITEFFIVQTFLGDNNSRSVDHIGDARFRGVYFLLATLLPFDAAMSLRERLIRYAADSQDHHISDSFIKLLVSREASEGSKPAIA